MKRAFGTLLMLLVLPCIAVPSARASDQAARPPILDVLAHVPGGNTSGGEVREKAPRADGYYHIDTPASIARLKAMHANNYNYLIWNSPSDWDDLRLELLPAAQKAGINIWVYLVPPTESIQKKSFPFTTDYVRWAAELAKLSLKYPVLQAWVLDDFTANPKFFNPEYVGKMQDAAHAINPKLRFFPVLQLTSLTDDWAKAYGPVIDGVVAPFLDLPYLETQRTILFNQQVTGAATALKPSGKPLYLLAYVGRHLRSPLEPSPEYVKELFALCFQAMHDGRLAGVVSYGTPMEDYPGQTESNTALDGAARLSLSFAPVAVKAGEWAQASQTITVRPGRPMYMLSFWHTDRWGRSEVANRIEKEVLLDDTVVWHQGANDDPAATWMEGGALEGPVDVTAQLKGKKTAKLTLRIRSVSAFHSDGLDVGFDRLAGEGFTITDPGFETGAGWTLSDSGQALMAAIVRHDTDLHKKVFQTVSEEFAKYSRRR
ncbi:MAG: hypothetical protein ABI142_12720 [Bryocella sp.]